MSQRSNTTRACVGPSVHPWVGTIRERTSKSGLLFRYSSRINARKSDILKDIKAAEKDLAVVEEKDSVKEDPQWTLSVTRDRHVEKEDLAEYIAKKREMFLVQYSLGVKRCGVAFGSVVSTPRGFGERK